MNNALIQCPACRAWLMGGPFNQREFGPCPACGVPLMGEVFPALFRKISTGQSGETIMVEGESGCFYHPQKKAVLPCDGCGRFLCALCDCLFDGKHYCPTCLEAGKAKGKIKNLDNQRTLYDSIALALAVYPLVIVIFYYFTFITAPMALFVAIRYWKAPRSIVRRTKVRFIVAILIALATIGGWATVLIYLATRHSTHA
jgi:hypothetical protein